MGLGVESLPITRPSETCVYCWKAPAVTSDHVFARKFFVGGREYGLPEVPSCLRCNRAKNRLETYVMLVLPFGGRHADAINNLNINGPRRMAGNRKMARKLARSLRRTWTVEDGVYRRVLELPFEWPKLIELGAYWARGLAWHHWGVRLDETTFVDAHRLDESNLAVYAPLLAAGNVRALVDKTLPGGTFRYRGLQAPDCAEATIWAIEVYGGLRSETSNGQALNIGVISGPAAALARGIAPGPKQT
jgi:hypothetical protein